MEETEKSYKKESEKDQMKVVKKLTNSKAISKKKTSYSNQDDDITYLLSPRPKRYPETKEKPEAIEESKETKVALSDD